MNRDYDDPGAEELGISWNREKAWSRLEQRLPRKKPRRLQAVIWPALAASIVAAGIFIAGSLSSDSQLSMARQQTRLPFTFQAAGIAYRTPAAVPAKQQVAYVDPASAVRKRKNIPVPVKKERSLLAYAASPIPAERSDSGTHYITSALLDIGRQPLCFSISRPENTLQ